MSSFERKSCTCCGRSFAFQADNLPDEDWPEMCSMCRTRGGLCLHNLWERNQTETAGVAHLSRPHLDESGADDPSTCQWCLARLLPTQVKDMRHDCWLTKEFT